MINIQEHFNDESKQWFTLSKPEVQQILEAIAKKDKVIRMQRQLIRELKK